MSVGPRELWLLTALALLALGGLGLASAYLSLERRQRHLERGASRLWLRVNRQGNTLSSVAKHTGYRDTRADARVLPRMTAEPDAISKNTPRPPPLPSVDETKRPC